MTSVRWESLSSVLVAPVLATATVTVLVPGGRHTYGPQPLLPALLRNHPSAFFFPGATFTAVPHLFRYYWDENGRWRR